MNFKNNRLFSGPGDPCSNAAAQIGIEVDLELILAADISGSEDLREGELPKRGHAKAL